MNRRQRHNPDVCQAEELAGRLGVSTWAIYESVRRGDCPVPPIRVGRRIVFARASVDRLLGLDTEDDETRAAHARVPSDSSTIPVTIGESHAQLTS